MPNLAFTPQKARTASLSVTAATGNVDVGTSSSCLVLTNIGSSTCYVELGTTSAITAVATTAFPVLPASQVIISRNPSYRYVAAICGGADTTTLRITPSEGSNV